MSQLTIDEEVERSAVVSSDKRYRYTLTRRWDSGPIAAFVMLNPSTADMHVDDPTIRRCVRFAQREKCGQLIVVNLFAWRATNPKILPGIFDPVGYENDSWLNGVFRYEAVAVVIAAWGASAFARKRADEVCEMAKAADRSLHCLGRTKGGAPRHPLYVRADVPLEKFA